MAGTSTSTGYSADERDRLSEALADIGRGQWRVRPSGALSATVFSRGKGCGTDTAWIELWSALGEALVPVVRRVGSPESGAPLPGAEDSSIIAQLGDDSLLIHPHLGSYLQGESPSFRGAAVARGVLDGVDEVLSGSALVAGATPFPDGVPLTAEDVAQSTAFVRAFRHVALRLLGDAVARSTSDADADAALASLPATARRDNAELIKYLWLRGALNTAVPQHRLPGIRLVAEAIARQVLVESAVTATFDDEDPYAILRGPRGLPPGLAREFESRGEERMAHLERMASEYGYHRTGIRPPGTTELDRVAFHRLLGGDSSSFLLLAPTSSGKTRFGYLAVSQAVHARRRSGRPGNVIVLAPTKALVNQISREMRELFSSTEADDWRVLEGSRDYPQYDEPLRSGNFDVAVCIPEKLAAMMRIGMRLDGVPLLVVDEFQHVVDVDRGAKLELLLVEILQRYPALRLIGLSASLDEGTREQVRRWLEANGKDAPVVEAAYRPVPLTLVATDGRVAKEIADNDISTVREYEVPWLESHEAMLTVLTRDQRNFASANKRLMELLLGLMRRYVRDDGTLAEGLPAMLVFVPSREDAERLADSLRMLVDAVLGVRPVWRDARPYLGGRFRASTPGHDPAALLRELDLLPANSTQQLAVRTSLLSGIGFHTASLGADGRDLVEGGFRDGYIRVLFATDTLKQGINTPTDIAINASPLAYAGNRQRLINADDVIQRMGRAGRFLVTEGRGVGYLIVRKPIVDKRLSVEIPIDARRAIGGSDEASDDTVLGRLATVDRVFDYFLSEVGGGAAYVPPQNDTWLRDAVLRSIASRDDPVISEDELAALAHDLHGRTIAGIAGSIDAQDVGRKLEEEGLVAMRDGNARLTRLGRATANHPIPGLEPHELGELAAIAQEGAGPFTLLFHVGLTDSAYLSSFRIRSRDGEDAAEHRERELRQVRDFLAACRPASPRVAQAYFRGLASGHEDLLGRGRRADALRAILLDDRTAHDDIRVLTALLRADRLTRWWGGTPFSRIEQDGAGGRGYAEADLVAIAEHASTVIGAVADYLATAPEDMTFRELGRFAYELEVGLPGPLASLRRVGDRALHRDRLRALLPEITDPSSTWDTLEDLVDRLAGAKDARAGFSTLDDATLDRIKGRQSLQRKLIAMSTERVDAPWNLVRVPSYAPETMEARLDDIAAGNGVAVVSELMGALGMTVDPAPDQGFVDVAVDAVGRRVRVVVAGTLVDQAFVDTVLNGLGSAANAVVIASRGATEGVVNRTRFQSEPCAVVAPSLFLEMVVRVYSTCLGDDDPLGLDEPELDVEASARVMRRMLINNAPVLTRADLENRLAHDGLAQDATSA
ncbi:DEAD/DEAH box helicase [Demequina gelatinilytica]|uniref:DEAD/DEAH box helicase n=1 Tax=Demequina gelatinilytica TaxID=1638980 RepID=UPI00078517B0|nr:DEAD/DEAH box helicase [Demequina gelatinilytica]